jgi:hypothetical protein
MERRTKDCRSNSCLDRSLSRNKNENRTSSFIEQSKMDSMNSSTESIQKHSTPKHELYKVKIAFKKQIN